MTARLGGRPVMILVVLAVWGLASLVVPAGHPDSRFAGPRVSTRERARIAALSDVDELVRLLKTGARGQKEAAVRALAREGRGDILLATARTGPSGTSHIIIELYQPKATAESDAKTKKEVDAYLTFLEEQLRSKSPIVGPQWAVRSYARTVYWRRIPRPREPRPAPRYQHRRVIRFLITLLKDKRAATSELKVERVVAGNAAARWLGNIGAYDLGNAQVVSDALTAYRQAVASAPASNKDEQKYKKMRLGLIDHAIGRFNRERALRIRFGVEGKKSKAKTPSTRRVSPEM